MPPGIAGGGREKTYILQGPAFATFIPFLTGDTSRPTPVRVVNPITISFQDSTTIFALSNGIKALDPPNRPFFLIHLQPKNGSFRKQIAFIREKLFYQ